MNDGIPHGIMLHHFSNAKHQTGQGAITADDLNKLIESYGKGRIISSNLWLKKAREGRLQDEICLTFDDALLSQYDIALPVLESHNLTAFWFIYSSVLEGSHEILEIYRKYRTSKFTTIQEFYNAFYKQVNDSEFKNSISSSLSDYDRHTYLSKFSFYSDDDRKFRYIRDVSLGANNYNKVMSLMLEKDNIDIATFSQDLWVNKKQVERLVNKNHTIGLHSHTHPTALADLPYSSQKDEYTKNNNILTKIIETEIYSMGHPNNSYDSNTLQILKDLGIEIGFCSNMSKLKHGPLEFPREDHTNIMRWVENQCK
jgi:peptidoglycan/xylan/chitin deacetylase (PgdA/CDA1 family)